MEDIYVVVTAAGSGRRLGTETPKQYLSLAGKPLLVHSLELLNSHDEISGIILVVAAGWEEEGRFLARKYGITKLVAVVTGGAKRQESVYQGLLAVPENAAIVLIHDAARPFLSSELVSRMIAAARRTGAAVPAIQLKDTVKVADPSGLVQESLERSRLVAVQTPQSFIMQVILPAHKKAVEDGFTGTDDAMLVERLGLPVELVPGEERNIKITTLMDLKLAELLQAE